VVVNFWEWNPTGCLGPGFSVPFSCFVGGSCWYRIAPVPICDASTSSSNCLEGSGLTSTGGFVMAWMICSCWCCNGGEILDEHPVVSGDAQEASCLPEVEDVVGIFSNPSDFGWVNGCAVFRDVYPQEVHLGLHED